MKVIASAVIVLAGLSAEAAALTPVDLGPEQAAQSANKPCLEMSDATKELADAVVRQCLDQSAGPMFVIYARALSATPGLKGSVVVDLSIAPDGVVQASNPTDQSTLPPDLAKKIADRLKAVRFPVSKSGWSKQYTLNYMPN